MIEIVGDNNNPETENGLASYLNVRAVDLFEGDSGICQCTCRDCLDSIPVFANVGGTALQNDRSTFLFRYPVLGNISFVSVPGDIELWRVGGDAKIVALNADPNYGTHYAQGTWTGSPKQQKYRGQEVLWEYVLDQHGEGLYYIQETRTIFGVSITVRSDVYDLQQYTPEMADRTIRLEWYQNGYIIGNEGWDWTGMNWYQQLRLYGSIIEKKPILTKDEILDSNRKVVQVENQVQFEWSVEFEIMPQTVWDKLCVDHALSNEVYVRDYNLCSPEYQKQLKVVPVDIPEVTTFELSKQRDITISFAEKEQARIKRNVR